MQLLIEEMHRAFREEVRTKNLAYVEVVDINDVMVDGGEVEVKVKVRLHRVIEMDMFSDTYVKTFTHDLTEQFEDLTATEILKNYKDSLQRVIQSEYAYNLSTNKSIRINELPAKTPFVAYVGDIDIRKMSAIYSGLTSVPNNHSAAVQWIEGVWKLYLPKQADYVKRVIISVTSKGAMEHMKANGYNTFNVKGSPMPYWTKDVLYNREYAKLYVTPLLAFVFFENRNVITVFNRFQDSIEQIHRNVSQMPIEAKDRKCLALLVSMTDLRKKAPQR